MANEKRLIDANALSEKIGNMKFEITNNRGGYKYCNEDEKNEWDKLDSFDSLVCDAPTVDAVEVVHGYEVGDVCFYGFYDGNKSLALVEIVKILSDERGVAEVKFLKVFVDNTGNGFFNYLLRSGNTMNASFKYLKNITPVCAKMDGGNEDG